MRKLMLLAGAAALGLTMPAFAQGQGRGGGQGHGKAAHAQHQGGGQARAERGHGRGNGQQARGQGNGRADRQLNRQERRVERSIQQERRAVRDARRIDRGNRGNDLRLERQVRVDRRDWNGWAERRLVVNDRFGDLGRRGLRIGPNGCPPGLANRPLCMPPGQYRKTQLIGQRLGFSSLGYNIPDRYRYRFRDDDRFIYRYGNDGTVYRFDRSTGLVNSIIPLTSAGLFMGQPLPIGYDVYNVPYAYRGYYPDSNDWMYRYDNGAIYRVNRDNNMVDSIVALLTGGAGGLGGLGVGDRLPIGYSAYNVPFGYRDTYYDTNDWNYRYADNSIYQVDPETQLIAAVISLLT